MKQAQRKSFDWYKMQQRFSIRKYHFGAASVLLGTALVLGVGAKAQTVQADEHYAEVTNSVSVDKIAEATKPVEVSTTKKETTYPAPTVVNPVETTPAKTEEATRSAEKVEEPKVEKEEVSHQSAVDKSKLLTALSRAKKLESKLYTEASAAKLRASIQAGQGLLGKADATEAEISAAESSIQSAVIGLELRSNSDKGTVSETSVAKKADAAEAKEEAKPAATTTDRSALDSSVLPTSRAAKVEATSTPATTNEILKPGLSLSDAHQNPAIRKEDLDKGQSGFRASSNPANPIVSGSGNTVAFADISQAGRSYSFRGYGNARGGHSIHYDVTTVRQGNRLNFTIQYSGPGEFVNNNFILDKGDGFGNPSNATITTPRLREQSKPISQGANFVSHSGYTMTSATETSMQQTIRFSLPINNPNGDLSVRLKPVTFNVDQGGGGAATSNDPYSNSNYYYRANPLYLDANPNGGSSNKVVTEDIDFQTVYLPTSKLPEGQTRLVREGEKGQRQITYKVHRFGNETILGLPISNSVTKEAKPRILQIGVAKELIDTVKPRVDQNKVGDTNNLTFYLDNDGNGVYTEGVDELVQKIAIKDGAKGEKGDQGERGLTGAQGAKGEKGDRGERGLTGAQGTKGEKGDRGERGLTGAQGAKGEKGDRGERGLTGAQGAKGEKGDRGEHGLTGAQGQAGRDGVTPTVTVKDNKDDGTHTITINDGRGNVTSTVVRDGFDGASPLVATQRNEADKTTTVIFYYDQNDNNEFDAGDTKLKEVVIADGAKGEKGDQGERGDRGETGAAGRDGKTPKITTARGADGRSTDITFTIPGEEPVTVNVKDGKDGRTPTIDLNALAEAAVRLNNQRSGRVRRALADAPSTAPAPQPVEGTRITAYYDNNGNGKYDPGVDELIGTSDILNGTNGRNGADGASGTDGRNGAELLSGPKAPTANDGKDGDTYIDATTGDVYKKEGRNWNQIGNIRGPQGLPGPKGDKGENGRDGFTPEVSVTDNHDGSHTITITQPEGRPALTTIVKNGENGQTPKVKAERDKAKKQTTLTFYIDKDGDGNYTEGTDTLVQTSIVKDGQDGAAGQAGRDGKEVLNGKVDPTPRDGKDGDSFVNTATGDVFVKKNNTWEQAGNIKGPKGDKGENGKDGFTPEVTVTDNHDGTHTITITQPEGRPAVTTTIKNGVDGQTPKVKAERDEAKKQTTLTFYIDKDGDGNYTEGTDTLVQTSIVKDGQDGATGQAGRDGKEVLNGKVDPTPRDGKDGDSFVNTATGDVFVKKNNAWEAAGNIKGPKGDKGENGRDGLTPEVTVTDNHDGTHTITITQPEGRPAVTTTIKNGVDGQTPKVKAERDEAKKQTTLTFYVDKDGDGNYTEGTDTLVQTSIVKDGEKGEDGKTPEVTVTSGKDGHSSDITFTVPGKTPVTVNVKNGENGLNGKTPKVDLLRVEGQNGNPSHTIVTFYTDENGDGKYTVGTDELLGSEMIKDGAKGADGRDGKSLLTVKEGKETKVYQEDPANPGQPLTPDRPLAVIRDGVDGKSPTVTAARKEEVDHKGVEITVDNHDGSQPTTVFVHDGAKGETGANGQNGQTPTVTTQRGADGHSTVVTITTPGKEPVTFTVRDGLDGHNGNNGRTPKIDLQPYVNGEDSFRRARRSVGNNPDEVSGHPNSRATSSDNADGTHVTVYFDNNGNNHYDPGVDELISERDVLNGVNGENGASGRDGRNGSELLSGNIAPTPKDGKNGDTYIDSSTGNVYKKQNGAWNKTGNIRGPQGAKGDTPEVTAKPGTDGHSTDITITTPGKDPVTVNVKNGKDGKSLIAKKEGNETKIFVEDPANPGQPLDATKPLATVLDGLKGEKGDNGADGKSPVVTMTDNGDGTHSITVRNGDGSESTTKVKDGKDGKTATITTTENPDGSHTITVTNPDGTSKETVVKNGKDGKTPKVEVTDNNDGTHTVKVTDGDGNVTNAIIKDGKDGKAASATTRENPDGSHTVTITNPDGTKNEFVVKNGRDGVDGRTPTASVRDNGDGSHTIVITNPEGVTTETTVHDGKSPKVTITDEQNGTHKISVLNGDGTTTETIIKDGKSPVATIKDNHDGTYTIRVENGNGTVSETTIRDGKSPTAKVVDNGDGTHTITVVNSDGTTTTTTVRDGKAPKLEVIDNNNGSHTIKVTGTDGKETTTTIFDGKSPKANIVDNGDGTHTLTIVDSDGREYKSIIKDGKDGVSPTVTVKNNNDGTHVVTIINPDGSKTEMVIKDGKDGKSPKVSVEDNGNGSHTITIINSDGTVTKTVIKDGKDGRDGRDGKDGKDGKCGCQDKPVTPSNDKPVPPTPNVPERPMFAMPEPPVHELPEYTGGVTPLDPPVYDKPEFNGGVPGMPEVTEVPELDIPTVPAQPIPNVPTPEVPVQPVPAVPEQPVVPTPAQPATPVNANPVVPTTVKENHGDKLPETGSQSDYISVLLGSGILLSLYVGRRKED